MNNQKEHVRRKIESSKRKRLSEPRIPPLEREEFNKVREQEQKIAISTISTINKSDMAKLAKLLSEREKMMTPVLGEKTSINIVKTLAKHRDFYLRYTTFNIHTRFLSTLPLRDKEILILRIAWHCYSNYEWTWHARGAKYGGLLSDDEINRIMKGPDAQGWDSFDATLIRAVDELYTDTFITDETWNALTKYYNTHQIMDLVFTVGNYNMLAMAINSFGVQLEEGLKSFLESNQIPIMK
jgi:alkylhydroperoxidase family enzyme